MTYDYKVERPLQGSRRWMAMAGLLSVDKSVFWPLSVYHLGNTVEEAVAKAKAEADQHGAAIAKALGWPHDESLVSLGARHQGSPSRGRAS